MRSPHRLALVAACTAALAFGAACGSGGSGATATATPKVPVSTASPAATSTTATTATSASGVAAATQPSAPAPGATAAPRRADAPSAPPTVAPPPTSAPPPPPPTPAEQSLTVVARDVKFVPSTLTARAGGVLHLTLDNQDAGVPHDIVVYDASGAVVAATDPATGPVQQTLTVTLGAPQRYTFKCSVHPQTMNGVLAAQ